MFVTPKKHPEFVDILIAGDNSAVLHHSRAVHLYRDEVVHQQMPNLHAMRYALCTYVRSFADFDTHSDIWEWMGDRLLAPSADVTTVFHQGSQSPLTALLQDVAGAIVDRHVSLLELPIRDASAVGAWYFQQFEELLRDVFRVYYSVPRVRRALAHGSHIGVHHSDYILPLPEDQEATSSEGERALAVVRKVFEIYVETYISQLQGLDEGSGHRGTVWSNGNLKVISLDVVSDRRKLKSGAKKKSSTAEDISEADESDADADVKAYEEEQARLAEERAKQEALERKRELQYPAKGTFSLGFLDKTQWKFLRSVLADADVTHLVINSQKPFFPLGTIPNKGIAPDVLPKGSILEWAPIEQDLESFLDLMFKWLNPRQGEQPRRHLVILSTAPVPYATTVVETRTGAKVTQLCVGSVGNADLNPNPNPNPNRNAHPNLDANPDATGLPGLEAKAPANLVEGGRIGTAYRYTHRLHGLEDVLVDSSRSVQLTEDSGEGRHVDVGASFHTTGLGQLRVWFDR